VLLPQANYLSHVPQHGAEIASAPAQNTIERRCGRRLGWGEPVGLVHRAALRLLGNATQLVQFAHVQARDEPREIHVGGWVGAPPSHHQGAVESATVVKVARSIYWGARCGTAKTSPWP
jgi:hypothetical protein